MQADPENRQYQKDYIATLSRLADLLAAQPARSAEVRALTEKALQTLQPLVARPDAGDYEIQQYVWLLLTTPFADLRSPAKALPFAEKAVRKTVERDPRVLDMLALAQFGVGRTREATETELKALALLPKDSDSALRRELEANLRKFRASPPTTKGR
jgi:tetratricopeptide (TPR) repeat protein